MHTSLDRESNPWSTPDRWPKRRAVFTLQPCSWDWLPGQQFQNKCEDIIMQHLISTHILIARQEGKEGIAT